MSARVTRGRTAVVLATVAAGAMVAVAPVQPARGFDPSNVGHRTISRDAVRGPSGRGIFLRETVMDNINDQHRYADAGFPNPSGRGARDQYHFDDCEFDGGAAYIDFRYRRARESLTSNRPFGAAFHFGNALHPVQDFYSHSNWVEIGFPLRDDPRTTRVVEGGVTQADLVDLSGAQSSFGTPWGAPDGGGIVRRAAPLRAPYGPWDILLGADDWDFFPAFSGWSIARNGRAEDPGGTVGDVPTLVDPEGRTRGKLLVTGEGSGDDECDVFVFDGFGPRAFNGFEHSGADGLNKDAPSGAKGGLYEPAAALAVHQTSYEWCRLVRDAAFARPAARDGLLLATWVRPGGNPHPPRTPCAPAADGPAELIVTIERIEVRDARDSDSADPGEIQIAAVLYDSPLRFGRSVHVTNRSGRHMLLDDGERVAARQLPRRLRLCVPARQGGTFAVHGWDDDDDADEPFRHEYDDEGGDADDLLEGFQQRLGRRSGVRVHTGRGRHLEVRYRVTRRNASASCRS